MYFKMSRSTNNLSIYFVLIYVCFHPDAFIREQVWYKALLMGYSLRLELMRISEFKSLMKASSWKYTGM